MRSRSHLQALSLPTRSGKLAYEALPRALQRFVDKGAGRGRFPHDGERAFEIRSFPYSPCRSAQGLRALVHFARGPNSSGDHSISEAEQLINLEQQRRITDDVLTTEFVLCRIMIPASSLEKRTTKLAEKPPHRCFYQKQR